MKARVLSGKVGLAPEVKAAMEAEADRMAREAMDRLNQLNELEIDAMVLYILHEQYGFGEKRLKRFYDSFSLGIRELGDRYDMEKFDERIWLCQRKLKEIGIDISEWAKDADERAGQVQRPN